MSKKITDNVDAIRTFEDICTLAGVEVTEYALRPGETPDECAYRKLKLICKVFNGGWVPDWKNSSEYKYYPWFDLSSGSGLACRGYVYGYSASLVGSRLCFRTAELAQLAAESFPEIYKEFLT